MKRFLSALFLSTVLTSCASAPAGANSSRGFDRFVISRSELEDSPAANMRDVIKSLRPDWLQRTAGLASSLPYVYLDGRQLGDLDILRTVGSQTLERACYHTVSVAQSRFGSLVRSPVIELVSLGRNPTWKSC